MRFYFFRGKTFGKTKIWFTKGINGKGQRFWKLVLPFGVFGFTY